MLVDERTSLGGHYYKQLLKAHVFDYSRRMDRQFQAGCKLIAEVEAAPGKHILLACNGPLNLQVASELTVVGVDVAAVAEPPPLTSATRLPAILRVFRQSPDLIFDGMNYLRRLVQAGAGWCRR